ncbi:MAG TPA: outer membrane beta-barrel protein [Nitrospirota bacterium]|nr:outer membrane beta-barrel protein [Nitrospirota bacterium]
MKRTVLILLVAFFTLTLGTMFHAKSARAYESGTYELDATIAPASGPGDYDAGFGVTFGGGYTLAEIDKNLQARFDISVYRFTHDFPWGSGTYVRVPFLLSGRYYVPIVDRLRVFGQAGLETSIDNFDNSSNQRQSEVNVGISPGAGVEFFVTPKVSIYALGLVHLISDSYFSMHFGVAAHF